MRAQSRQQPPGKKRKDERFIAFGCLHTPYNDPDYTSVLTQVIRWFKPDHLFLIGDILDGAPISHWLKDKRRQQEGLRLSKDYAVLNAYLDEWTRHTRHLHYLEGNHEDWIHQAIDLQPEFDGLINLEIGLRFAQRAKAGLRITHRQYNEVDRLGKLWFTHGTYTGMNHARKHAEKFQRNLLYAHTHTVQAHVNTSPVDVEDKHLAKSIGCGCSKNPTFMRNKPNDWVHAFEIGVVRKDGTFGSDTVIVTKGVASYGGRTFRSRLQEKKGKV